MMASTDHLGLFGCRSKSAARGKKFLSPKWTAGLSPYRVASVAVAGSSRPSLGAARGRHRYKSLHRSCCVDADRSPGISPILLAIDQLLSTPRPGA